MATDTDQAVSVTSHDDSSVRIRTGPFVAAYDSADGQLRLRRRDDGDAGYLSIAPGRETPDFDVLDPDAVEDLSVTRDDGVTVTISGTLGWASYVFTIDFPSPGLLSYELAVTPEETDDAGAGAFDESTAELSFRTDDGLSIGDGVVSYLDGTPGSVNAAGMDDLNQFVYCAAPDALDATVLYLADFGALSQYYEQTDTEMQGTVSFPPGRFGYDVPRPEAALHSGSEVVLLDATLSLDPGAIRIEDPVAYSERFVTSLADVYPHVDKPSTERVDWPDITGRVAAELDKPEYKEVRDGVTYPGQIELMTLVGILRPFTRFAREFDADLPAAVLGNPEVLFDCFYDPEYDNGSGRTGLLANSEAPHSLSETDAWYFLWPITQVAEHAAAYDSERLREMVLDSAASAIELARALDYVFPMWLDVDGCDGSVGSADERWHGYQYDCTGAFVYLMEQCYEFTGESRYLDEARAAGDRLLDMGFELPYEFTTASVIPFALLRLSELTGEQKYLRGSYIGLANILRHSYLFDPEYGHYEDRTIFLLTEAMPANGYTGEFFENNYYANAMEELSLVEYLERYLDEGQSVLTPAAKQMTAELLRYKGTSLKDSLAPLQADPSLVYDGVSPQSGRRIDPDVYLPLEPFGAFDPMFSQLGELDQATYGPGVYPAIARVQYHPLGDALLYADVPVALEQTGESRYRVDPLGAAGTVEATLFGPDETVSGATVTGSGGDGVDTSADADGDSVSFSLDGDGTYELRL
jgi:hypothetical protein